MVVFTQLKLLSNKKSGISTSHALIELHLEDRAARQAIRDALLDASADSVVRLTLRGCSLPDENVPLNPPAADQQWLIGAPAAMRVSHEPDRHRWQASVTLQRNRPLTVICPRAYNFTHSSPASTSMHAGNHIP
ncbi:hypothetical protein [Pseudomonas rubra]|uniref:Uncharacterized protein n=1 Tax=Pseudomonas rubra TaxID=2942627 RepID=A0ABT5PC49_9PSED|nr:hypothetical protein [Pseudomonas rubra]MDD1015886.1 hypothetical protein [Pseudomonas rubra]MDD1040210.1 hypothetical protein [Pseudomonas rubra]MDD1157914.1 hypothetical protein [Pseudomonas rubra]